MKHINNFLQKIQRFLLCIACLACISTTALAESDLWKNGAGTVTSSINDGYIEITFPIYDADGYDEGLFQWSYFAIQSGSNTYVLLYLNASGTTQGQTGPHWAEAYRTDNAAYVEALHNGGTSEIGTSWSARYYWNKVGTSTQAKYRIYLSSALLASTPTVPTISYTGTFYLDYQFNKAGGHGTNTETHNSIGSFTTSALNAPSITSVGNSTTAGKYEITFNVAQGGASGKAGSKYSWESNETNATEGITGTGVFDLTSSPQDKTVDFWHKVSPHVFVKGPWTTTRIPAYQRAIDFTAAHVSGNDNTNADTKLTWRVDGAVSPDYGNFIIRRSTEPTFANPSIISTFEVTYKDGVSATDKQYEYIDKTSAENFNNRPVYYQISRTSPSNWKFESNVTQSDTLDKSMTHKSIASATAAIDADSKVTVSWVFNTGNVALVGSKIVIQRKRLDNQQVDIVAELDYYTSSTTTFSVAVPPTSFVDSTLTAMCKEFEYSVFVRPGNNKYETQTPVRAIATMPLVPTKFGNVGGMQASKGYFSDRVELEWDLIDGAAETFSIQRRVYGSTNVNDYQQLDTKPAFESAQKYTYTDVTCVPGIIYEYRAVAMTTCATGVNVAVSAPDVGFRTPTGDFYGRVTFENGQGESDVIVTATTDDNISAKSLSFATGTEQAKIDNLKLLDNAVTLQAWVSPKNAAAGSIISKSDIYTLGIDANSYYYFKAGDKTVTIDVDTLNASALQLQSQFIHLTGVYTGSKLIIYLNGDSIKVSEGAATFTDFAINNNNALNFGGNGFIGNIDEVRIWNQALSNETIKRDYNRYITGGEADLAAYYTFNYATNTDFYDVSYSGNNYNAKHGKINTAALDTVTPSVNQLAYKGVTKTDGSYSIRAIPYKGNGSAYTVSPTKGNHQFESVSEIRFLSAGSQSHTVNFTDKSSFKVWGYVKYENSEIPVKGVNFYIDGQPSLNSNGTMVESEADGKFEIRVPIGMHEVKAQKANHVFFEGGRLYRLQDRIEDGNIVGIDTLDRDYQDHQDQVILRDITKVKFIGRVAGGTIQEAFPLGHSLSKNNIADSITVTMTLPSNAYPFDTIVKQETHFTPSNKDATYTANTNRVEYGTGNNGNEVKIHVNNTTGEFVANVIPEIFNVKVNAPGHDFGDATQMNLTQMYFQWQNETHQYKDSVLTDTVLNISSYIDMNGVHYDTVANYVYTVTNYNDTVTYQVKKNFIKRYPPIVRVEQVNRSNQPLPYFGSDTITVSNMTGEQTKVPMYAETGGNISYTFDKPVFEQNKYYNLKLSVFEKYDYKDKDGYPVANKVDEVPTQDAAFKFNNAIAEGADVSAEVTADSTGVAYYAFKTGTPALIDPTRMMGVTVKYGKDPATSISWTPPSNFINGSAYLTGAIQQGTDFITAGPDKVLTVLRDPPGSNSYSFLEKGVSFTESSTYTGGISHEGSEVWTTGLKARNYTWTGVGGGVMSETSDVADGFDVGIYQTAEYTGQDSKNTTTTATTRFQTSASPDYVGADADVFIGYSTNITVGTTNNITIVSDELLNEAGATAFETVYAGDINNNNWHLVQTTGISMDQSFNTLFAYPQTHIENILIPNIISLRDGLLKNTIGMDTVALRNMVDADSTKVFYYSYFSADSEHFGKSNNDPTIAYLHGIQGAAWTASQTTSLDGPSYKIIYNSNAIVTDTIFSLNQSVDKWIIQLLKNEEAKVKVTEDDKVQNYSFTGASPIEYSESYSTGKSHESSFSISVGVGGGNAFKSTIFGATVEFAFNENVATTHGGTFSSEVEASHSKGFVLEEEGSDYLSVDVFHEYGWKVGDEGYGNGVTGGMVDTTSIGTKDYYSSFIFKTMGGATACPYEDEIVAKYYQPEQNHILSAATIQKENPYIYMSQDFIEYVPSGEMAQLSIKMNNNSIKDEDGSFILKIDNASNPYGARIYVAGQAIIGGLHFDVPSRDTLVQTIEVGRGSVMNYDGLKLILQSECQPDVYDSVMFSVHFTPSCSNINIKKPSNNWTYNTATPSNGMEVLLNGFNVNYDNFERIDLQYKSAAQSDEEWTTLISYYNDDNLANTAIFNGMTAAKLDTVLNSSGEIVYRWDMSNAIIFPDQRYDLRAVTVCNINNDDVKNPSEVRSGLKDTYKPRLFGAAQPADGVLDVGDEIRLNFNETIDQSMLTVDRFSINAVKNGTIMEHNVSVDLDGANDYLATELNRNLLGKSLTVEMWVNPDIMQNATLFSHGDASNSLELSLTAANELKVKVGSGIANEVNSQKFYIHPTSENPDYTAGGWHYIAMVYDAADSKVTAYFDAEAVANGASFSEYSGIGNIVLGKSIAQDGYNYDGKIHNVRVWEKVIDFDKLNENKLAQLSGMEEGLVAYYPLEEGRGTTSEDKARGATLIMNGGKWALPEGYAATFNGDNLPAGQHNYLKIPSSSSIIRQDMDFTIEFWFKADPSNTNATILASGRGDTLELEPNKLFNIGFDNGILTFTNNNAKIPVTGNYLDNNWHHFAVGVDRTINRGQICIDGNLAAYTSASNFGELASTFIYAGARKWHDRALNTETTDNYFKGSIDDLRFWKLYRSEQMIKENNNVKLTGNELGLLDYYPFEYYESNEQGVFLRFNYKDMHIGSIINPDLDEFEIVGPNGYVATQESAPLKNANKVSKLDFNYVINNDAVIITLLEPEYMIAKTIVDFTVDYVYDLNGNKSASPITWSAYIDRNQIRWETDRVDIVKPEYEPYEFTVKAVNSGGAIRNYTIQNAPSWLTVTPSSGTITPRAYNEIHFSINEGLNVGTYDEVIYLVNDENVAEPLMLKVKINGEEPDWSVDPSDFRYSMSIFGKMRFNNIFSADSEDILAAFDSEGNCVGKTKSTYNRDFDMWYALLPVYSNTVTASGLEFRMWDASTGKTYQATPDNAAVYNFVNDEIYGTPAQPVIFDGSEIFFQNIALNSGWNWVSFNLANDSLVNITRTLNSGHWSEGDIIKNLENFDSYSVAQHKWSGTLSALDNVSMFMINSALAQSVGVSGSAIDTRTTPITVKGNRQWSYISYLPSVNTTVNEALAGYAASEGDVIKSQNSFAMYSQNRWTGNLTYMEANKGYMLRRLASDDVTFNYPSLSGSLSSHAPANKPTNSEDIYCNYRFAENMSVVATSIDLQAGDQILAYVNGNLRGVGECSENGVLPLSFITLVGSENGTIHFELERNGISIGKTGVNFSYIPNSVKGTTKSPIILDFGVKTLNSDALNANIYPNPFRNSFKIEIEIEQSSHIDVKVIDVAGRTVLTQNANALFTGTNTITVNGSDLATGIYIVKITTGSNTGAYILEKIK